MGRLIRPDKTIFQTFGSTGSCGFTGAGVVVAGGGGVGGFGWPGGGTATGGGVGVPGFGPIVPGCGGVGAPWVPGGTGFLLKKC